VAIDSVFPLAQAQMAHERAAQGHLEGKIVLSVMDSVSGVIPGGQGCVFGFSRRRTKTAPAGRDGPARCSARRPLPSG
jgi:hypothetical protein